MERIFNSNRIEKRSRRPSVDSPLPIHYRFERAAEQRVKADASVEAGREFVEAYVQFTHYIEGVRQVATGTAGSHGSTTPSPASHAGHKGSW